MFCVFQSQQLSPLLDHTDLDRSDAQQVTYALNRCRRVTVALRLSRIYSSALLRTRSAIRCTLISLTANGRRSLEGASYPAAAAVIAPQRSIDKPVFEATSPERTCVAAYRVKCLVRVAKYDVLHLATGIGRQDSSDGRAHFAEVDLLEREQLSQRQAYHC